MKTPSSELRSIVPRPVWMSARARNAMRRPIFIGTVSAGTFIAALVALVVVPQRAQRAAEKIEPSAADWPDTAVLVVSAGAALAQLAAADSALTAARTRKAELERSAALDALTPSTLAERDSLSQVVARLDELLSRAENAPLPASYRALAGVPEIAADPRVAPLLDSLAQIEKEREGFGAVGGVDPVFVALTSRATDIGRSLQEIGASKREALSREIESLAPRPDEPSLAQMTAADTVARLADRDSARVAYESATNELAVARTTTARLNERAERARQIASVSAPPFVLVGAALVLGVVLGFGTALIDELRHPRIADEHEAERVSGARLLSVMQPTAPAPERARRSADRLAPPYLNPRADGHQLLYLAVASSESNLMMLTITGEEPAIAAVVAANFAAISAEEARTTLLIDTDAVNSPVASALQVPASPGVVEIIDERMGWPEATIAATTGRDRTIDVVPSGIGVPVPATSEIAALLKRDMARVARHYDTIVLCMSEEQALSGVAGVLPISDVVYCVRVGHTRLKSLRRAMEALASAGGNLKGIVVWSADPPPLQSPQELAAGRRPARSTVPEALSTTR